MTEPTDLGRFVEARTYVVLVGILISKYTSPTAPARQGSDERSGDVQPWGR